MNVDRPVYLDYTGRDGVPSMVVGGMTVVERILREAASAGATRAVIRGRDLPALPMLPLAIEIVPPTRMIPPTAEVIAGDVIAGVTISDERSRRAASRALFQTCRRPYDGLGDRYVIRAISLRLTNLLCRARLTPNQVTSANIVIGLGACYAVALGTITTSIIAGALMFAQIVFDSCDGELARIRHMHSRFGMWLDNTSDDVIDNLFVAMLGVGLGGCWVPVGVAAAAARAGCALMIHLDVARRGRAGDILSFRWWFDTAGEDLADRFDTRTSLRNVLRSLGRRDLYVLVFSAACLAGVPIVALGLGVVISVAYFVLAIAHVVATRGSR